MKLKQKLLILTAVVITALIIVAGCVAPPTTETSIIIAGGDSVTNDSTPTLTISATGAVYMAFSGNGTTWSSWITYATSYSSFNIISGAGCSTGDGTKTVYVKFKNTAGTEFGQCLDGITYDATGPKLLTAVYSDAKSKGSGTVNTGDTITFTFDDEMDTSTVTSSNVATRLVLSAGTYGSSPTVAWSTSKKVCTVTLGASPTVASGATVNPSLSVTDAVGNADISSAVTITGFTTSALASVTISPASKSYIEGDTTTTNFTAVARNGAGTVITSSCTFAWTESGLGTISPATGSSTVYTPASSGTGTNTITVSATYLTVTKTDTSLVTISASTVTGADPAKLFIDGRNEKAKYTLLPSGATSVVVYSHAERDPLKATTAGKKYDIRLSDTWTGKTASIAIKDYIYFTIYYSDATEKSAWDGQMPDTPDALALKKIQATGKNTATSGVGGTVVASDKITLYVSGTQYCDPTTVGSTMALTTDLEANDAPQYTRTNANGHESVLSATDGKILIPTAADANGGVASGTLDAGDTITLSFAGGNVDVTAPITVSNIDWVSNLGTAVAALDTGTATLAAIDTDTSSVVLIATANCADFGTGEVITFNIKSTIPIEDHAGGNQVLPLATDKTFTESSF